MSWLPARTAPKRSAITPTKSSYAERSTSTREPAEQVCPPFCTIAATTTGAAASMSASANRTWGDLPPSSRVQPIWFCAAAA
jgi:hypothetical protein